MRYSDWQLGRLRDALRAYHRYGRGADGSYFNWKDVSEAIAESTDVAIPPERLRQFVEGINTKEGGRKFPVPQDAWLAAIIGFATDADNDLLSADELEEPALPWQAARRLLDYLDQAFDRERIMPPESLAGRYALKKEEEDGALAVRTITLQRPSEDGLLQVLKTEEFYSMISPEAYEQATPEERRFVRESEVVYGGWAILTPEDNLLIFLKKEHNGLNRYYLTLASDLSHAPGSQASRLVLLHHDYPLEPDEGENDRESILEALHAEARNKIMLFERID